MKDNRDNLIAHIQALDTIIRNRNAQIAELQKQLIDIAQPQPPEYWENYGRNQYLSGWVSGRRSMRGRVEELVVAITRDDLTKTIDN